MKFLALKHALEAATPVQAKCNDTSLLPPSQAISRKELRIVCGGAIKWKPIDKLAARILWKAPWWAHLIYEQSHSDCERPAKTANVKSPHSIVGKARKAGRDKNLQGRPKARPHSKNGAAKANQTTPSQKSDCQKVNSDKPMAISREEFLRMAGLD